ncbi:VOC family protein [Kineococcus terrestris]|uniref:VOC family protein n=1 Tax=Kineococcus terrestris TaxID=2044856 RepID=UPI0034DAFD4D
MKLGAVALDTPDPAGLARFYAGLLGWEVDEQESSEDWVEVRGDGHVLAFQLAPDHVRPTWPAGGVPQQVHLDLHVPAFEDAERRALELGATVLDTSPQHPTWRVYADPAGHPFCLCLDGSGQAPEEASGG